MVAICPIRRTFSPSNVLRNLMGSFVFERRLLCTQGAGAFYRQIVEKPDMYDEAIRSPGNLGG